MSPFAAPMARETAALSREARALAEPALQRASLALVAALLAAAGAGFLLSAAYPGLVRPLGPGGAGLSLGAALLACGVVPFRYFRRKRPGRVPAQVPAPERPERPAAPPAEGEPAPLAAFTAAFVRGRQLRRRQTR